MKEQINGENVRFSISYVCRILRSFNLICIFLVYLLPYLYADLRIKDGIDILCFKCGDLETKGDRGF